MNHVVERLRASKQKAEAADYEAGLALGKTWAEQSAEAEELHRLEELHDELTSQHQFDWNDFFSEQNNSAYSVAEGLLFAMNPESDGDRGAAKDFWECVTGDALKQAVNSGTFLKGFADGALELWLSVKDEL